MKGNDAMNAEIISVGTELLLGHTVNTDTTIVAQALSDLGINMLYACTVGDNEERLRQALQQALVRSDLVITTGGLGPTKDDLTKETIAAVAGKHLVEDAGSRQRIEQYFAGRSCSENQFKQALLPKDCTVLPNDAGTAPGCVVTTDEGKMIMMFPGPPSELKPMLYRYAVPFLQEKEQAAIYSDNIHVFGKGEGAVAQQIAPYLEGENPTAAPYAKDGEMFVRVTAKAKTKQQAAAICEPVTKEIVAILGDVVYGVNVDTLEQAVFHLLSARGETVATAESCTGGLLSKRLTDIAGVSKVFEMGVCTYSNRIKHMLIDVSDDMLRQYGAVSEQVAKAMAEGVRKKAGSTYGIGITGIAGPTGGSDEKPVGLVYIGFTNGTQTWIKKLGGAKTMQRSREYYRTISSSTALDILRRYLQGLNPIA